MDDKSKEELFDSTEIKIEEIEKSNKSEEWEFVSAFEVDSYPVPFIPVPKMYEVVEENRDVGNCRESEILKENIRLEQQTCDRKEVIKDVKHDTEEQIRDDKMQEVQAVGEGKAEHFLKNKQKKVKKTTERTMKEIGEDYAYMQLREVYEREARKAPQDTAQEGHHRSRLSYGQQSEIKSKVFGKQYDAKCGHRSLIGQQLVTKGEISSTFGQQADIKSKISSSISQQPGIKSKISSSIGQKPDIKRGTSSSIGQQTDIKSRTISSIGQQSDRTCEISSAIADKSTVKSGFKSSIGQQSASKSKIGTSIGQQSVSKSEIGSFSGDKSYERICFEIEEAMNDIVVASITDAGRYPELQNHTSKFESLPKEDN